MWTRWFPWRYVVSRLARTRGFIDPIAVLSRLDRFAQPSEVHHPVELLRAGVIFHARGLINARAIQHNLDWVWPYWIERQFDPLDDAFVPRAFSITHTNLTHRNWTAVGVPDFDPLPIVDPRGLVTPHFDGWSIDAWIIPDRGAQMLPSRTPSASQRLIVDPGVAVETRTALDDKEIRALADVAPTNPAGPRGASTPFDCRVRYEALADSPGWLAVVLRPANPEGVSFIHRVEFDVARASVTVNDKDALQFDRKPERTYVSCYRDGDVLQDMRQAVEGTGITCDIGMATAAAMFRLRPAGAGHGAPDARHAAAVEIRVPLCETDDGAGRPTMRSHSRAASRLGSWPAALEGACTIDLPDERMAFLFDAAARTLILHCSGDVYPGPYTYKRFWFRDAAYILDAILALGLFQRVERAIDRFPERQSHAGYFRSQDGEWDSNGAALWIMRRFGAMSGRPLPAEWIAAAAKGARWIARKRLCDDLDDLHAGLMPAGFSAEHLGPNDYYYWDDFWSVAGLEAAEVMLAQAGEADAAREARDEAAKLRRAVDRSLERSAPRRSQARAIPASPHRRMDAGAIGSVACGYPLRLWPARDPRLLGTVEFLLRNCVVRGGFFQDMIHSGINAYLTLHLAQVLLRAGDERFFGLVKAMAELASPTGQWPEAVHPRTLGGCMGDGQHVWAAAEWVLMMRNLFVREEGDGLVLGSGIVDEWLESGRPMRLGPTPTPFGPITVRVEPRGDATARVSWTAQWRGQPPPITVAVPGYEPVSAASGEAVVIRRPRFPTMDEKASRGAPTSNRDHRPLAQPFGPVATPPLLEGS